MPFKLRITSEEEGGAPGGFERQFVLPEVHVGSSTANELVLVDAQRSISRRHARIFRDGDSYFVEDTQSRNGTQLNGRALPAQRPMPLAEGDRIRIGPFTLNFEPVSETTERLRPPPGGEGPTMVMVDIPTKTNAISDSLRRVFADTPESSPEDRRRMMEEIVSDGLADPELDSRSRREILRKVREKFPDRSYELVRLQQKLERKDAEISVGLPSSDLHIVAYEAIRALMGSLDPVSGEPAQAAEVQQFGEALRGVLRILIENAHTLLQGRTEWQREFDIEHSVQMRVSNPVKSAASAEALAGYLFSVHAGDPLTQRLQLLTEALQNLSLHQIAIIAGYEESIKSGSQWLLQELSPENFQIGAKSIFGGGKGDWNKFAERHRELTREDNKRIQARFLNGFNKGYEQKLDELKKFRP